MLSQSLPLLPGYFFKDPTQTRFIRPQLFNIRSNTCLEKPRYIDRYDQSTKDYLNYLTTSKYKLQPPSLLKRSSSLTQSCPSLLPQWLKYDKKVLQFDGYFNEHVTESAYENYRIRQCVLLYYLEDDSIHIKEKKAENSGMMYGEFIKRHRIITKDPITGQDKYYTWKDLKLGEYIKVYGKSIKLCKCDEYTKCFYKDKGIDIGIEEEIPEVSFAKEKLKNVDFTKIKKTIAELKEYNEVSLNGGHPNKGLKQFLENDRKVLCFEISWFDPYDKEEKQYKMNYYLSDGQVEICEVRESNSGKDPFPRLLRKSKLPKAHHMVYCPGLEVKEDEYYTPKDFILGHYISIYNRKCRIIGCDAYTRQWYKDNMGVDMDSIKIKRNPPIHLERAYPPHNGFGKEEDSLLNCIYLDPQGKIRELLIDQFKRDKHILRYNAKLISGFPSDEERMFIISFFVRDEAVMVYEKAERNSGRQSCKFIEKQRVKNPYTNKYYTEKDFIPGNVVYINKYIFKLINCDEYTRKYMVDNKEMFKEADIDYVINRIKAASNKYDNFDNFLIELLKKIDAQGSGWVTRETIDYGLKELGVYLRPFELDTLIRELPTHQDNSEIYSMEQLYNIIAFGKKSN